jgi:CheY-like chemotaxis protein
VAFPPGPGAPALILVVEDNPEDYVAARRALERLGVAGPVHRCTDGDAALDYLRRRGPYADAGSSPRPGIILLDLNLPGTDGREVLAAIKGDRHLGRIPVIVLTTSADADDVDACYGSGANAYMQKPVDLAGFMAAMRALADYWLRTATLPAEGGA